MFTELKPYPQMKDSGVEWLGQVPAHWEIRRLRSTIESCVNGIWGSDCNGRDDLVCVRAAACVSQILNSVIFEYD